MADQDKENLSLDKAIRTLEGLLEQNREILDKIENDNAKEQFAQRQASNSPPTLVDIVKPQQIDGQKIDKLQDVNGASELALHHSKEIQEVISSSLEDIIYTEIRKATSNVQNAILKEVNAQLELTLQALNVSLQRTRELPPPEENSGEEGMSSLAQGIDHDTTSKNLNEDEENKSENLGGVSLNYYRQAMEKTYDPHAIEQRCYQHWEESEYFKPTGKGKPYCIMLPPPNVTGSLHMGHAFQDTLMDILIRYHRMKGDNTLWQCGTDHAGIATQMVVERQLAEKELDRHSLGREKFTEEVWKWKKESGGNITRQLRRMGTSMDWSRERFTLDDGLSEAVVEVFVQLHEEGLIYRGKRLVNWDPVLHTAISDLEVVSEEESGHLWHIKYPIVDSDEYMVVATTRPETMLGDAAVAVHPEDERYTDLVGKELQLPLTQRTIPIIVDDYVDPEFGSGCVKITPAHDFNDYEVGQRHDLPLINVLTEDAAMNDACPLAYQGMDRYEARKRIIADLEAEDLIERIEDHKLMVPRGDRSQAVVEPYLTDQWYVKVEPLAKPAIEAVENGDINFVPENWSKTYFEWMRNIEDWCISRQLWWGHRIPAWYDQENNIYVGRSEDDVRRKNKLGSDIKLTQDQDVLDTWFSSSLWPFSTLGWPKKTPELDTFYPTNVLVTGFDIIFFWVARMIMMGLKFTGEVPFREVYIHGLVRDADGQKMSKSKGNIIDPIDLIDGIDLESLVTKRTSGLMQPKAAKKIEKSTRQQFAHGIQSYGTDALRFTFAAQATLGRDIRFDLGRIDGYRNFCNKIWNATRYVIMTTEDYDLSIQGHANPELGVMERWIITRFQQVVDQTDGYIDSYRFDLAAQAIYEFIWDEYCDWYLELSKVTLNSMSSSDTEKFGTRRTLLEVLEGLLKLIHPFMPYITEELWQRVAPSIDITEGSIMNQEYPRFDPVLVNQDVLKQVDWIKEFVLGVRRIRAEMDISPGKKLRVIVEGGSDQEKEWLRQNVRYLVAMGKLESMGVLRSGKAPDSATALAGKMTLLIPLEGIIDPVAEKERLSKGLEKLAKERQVAENKLANPAFVERAPEEVVKKAQDRLDEVIASEGRLKEQLDKFEGMIK